MCQRQGCGICGGSLALRFGGTRDALEASELSPTYSARSHADIYRCVDCGTLQQSALLGRADLSELYREMRDGTYLSEEQGRRRTARRLLDMISEFVPTGRLLDVGCGHGLLLDEARSRGYQPTGLELSAAAAAYARDSLHLDVREIELEQLDDGEQFNVITLVDVLEHLGDPTAAVDRCRDLLSPGGLLCVVTPDPSSIVARVASRRWWALIPAHTCLIPHRTLLELLIASGFAIAADVPFVRSFSATYWITGLAQCAGSDARPVRALARVLDKRLSLSLSLRDERVVLASKVPVQLPPQRLVNDRGGELKVHVVLPAYNAARTIPLVAAKLPIASLDRALLVDDASGDETTQVALREGFEVIRHPANRGYGANQKTCYARAALDGADVVVMVHADHQYDPALVPDMVRPILEGRADVVIGSRLLNDRAIAGGMPRWKWLGNRFLTAIENAVFRRSYSEYHTGYRAFSVDLLRSIAFLRNSDGFVFDQQIFAQIVARDARTVELPIPTHYFLDASSVSFRASVAYGLNTLWVLARFRADMRSRKWSLLRPPAVRLAARGGADGQFAAIASASQSSPPER
jgi:SAM-dependent methyltransferase